MSGDTSEGPPETGEHPVSKAFTFVAGTAGAFWTFARYAAHRFYDDRGLQASASLTFTSLLAIVPLTTIGVAILSAFPAFTEIRTSVQELVVESLVPQVGSTVLDYLESFTSNAGRMTAFGIVGLIVSAVLLLATIEDAFNGIWRVHESRPWLVRLLTFWAVLTLTPLLFAASISMSLQLLASTTVDTGSGPIVALAKVAPIVFEVIGLTLLFWLIPNRHVKWHDAAIGGVVSALLFEVAKTAFGLYIEIFPTYQTIYGALATIPSFLLWLFLAWSIVLLGAVVAASLPDWRAGRRLGSRIESLLPARRLLLAVAVLREFASASRLGVSIKRSHLVDKVPIGAAALDGMLEQLRRGRFVDRLANDQWVLSRDIHVSTLFDLMRAIGIGLRGVGGPITGVEGVGIDRVRELIDRTERSEADIMGVPLAEVLLDQARAAGQVAGTIGAATPPERRIG